MERKERKTILIYGSSRGFTLIETLIALSIIVIAFTVFLDLLARARYMLEEEAQRYEDMVILDNKIKRGELKDVKIREKAVEDFPGLREVIYIYNTVSFKRYEQR